MAGEIWRQLQEETLTNAANLTDEDQLASISRWLCSL
ncbi:AvaI/BsoBI family type II restriction endonuclease [Coleofasciculus sp. G2-EDA-02]